jgi:hypothetical protein
VNTEYTEYEGTSLLLTEYHAGNTMSTACRQKKCFSGYFLQKFFSPLAQSWGKRYTEKGAEQPPKPPCTTGEGETANGTHSAPASGRKETGILWDCIIIIFKIIYLPQKRAVNGFLAKNCLKTVLNGAIMYLRKTQQILCVFLGKTNIPVPAYTRRTGRDRKGDYNERQQNVGSCKRKSGSWTCPQTG